MTYEFKYTERNNEISAQFETKSLLHLIGKHKQSGKLSVVFIDCFNDMTGCDDSYSHLCDLQSKGVANMFPGDIGESLVTLFLNQISTFPFSEFVLFSPKIKPEYLIDASLNGFGAGNFIAETMERIKSGLKKEAIRRESSLNDAALDEKIKKFMDQVRFVIDDKHRDEYVKEITDFKDKDRRDKKFYESIFSDISSMQIKKKQSSIHGRTIQNVADALNFERHIYVFEISQLLANRFVGTDLFKSKGIPIPFIPETVDLKLHEISELKQECLSGISIGFFDKNKQHMFWKFLENVLNAISDYPKDSAREIYNRSSAIPSFKDCGLFGISGIYFVSLIMEGLNQ